MELLKANFLSLQTHDADATSREGTTCLEDVDKITKEWEEVICAPKEPACPKTSVSSTHNEPSAADFNLDLALIQGKSASESGAKSLLEDDEDMTMMLDMKFPLFQSIQIPPPARQAGTSKPTSSAQPALESTTPKASTPNPTPNPNPNPSPPPSDSPKAPVESPKLFNFAVLFDWWRPAQRVWSPQHSSIIQVIESAGGEWSYKLLNSHDVKEHFSVSAKDIARIHNERAVVFMVHAGKGTVYERVWRFKLVNEKENTCFQEMVKESGGGGRWVNGVPR